ncbi:MAG: helix-turn-helix transcriptional regulator [Acetobacterium sp.]|uniref:helix-turn-helix domain-containing protein n=1 Tax=Acetobacterium sp. TaxID=1872094 RepID=UPI0032420FE6
MQINEIIKKERESKNLTQSELLELSGISKRSISHWESGNRMPHFDSIKPVLDVLGLKIEIVRK